VITVTNLCPQGSEGGWCNMPRRHLDMAVPAWQKIGRDLIAGVISTNMERVPCVKKGGIKFRYPPPKKKMHTSPLPVY